MLIGKDIPVGPGAITRLLSASMAKLKLGILDYLQRGMVYSCVGLSIYAVGMSILIHRDTMRKGEGE
jgi:hypothetical protein